LRKLTENLYLKSQHKRTGIHHKIYDAARHLLQKRFILPIFFFCQFSNYLIAQDIHFSQYNASPLTLNPALTGFFDGDFRAIVNYRGQWGSFTNPYRTIAASFEYDPLKGKMKYDNFCIGLMIYNDVAGTSRFGSNNIGLSTSYRKQLGTRNNHTLSIGLQASALQQRIQFKDLQFDNQYNGVEWDENIAPNEVLNESSNFAPDLSTGLLWQTVRSDAFNFYVGASYYHILQPKISLFNASDYRLPSRLTAHAGGYIYLTPTVNLLPSVAYYRQSSAWQANGGTYIQFVLDDWNDKETAFAIGAWARVAGAAADAVIAGARLDFQGFILSFAYDFNISKLNVATDTRGAYELSFIYSGAFSSKAQRRYQIPCPQL
jgi:type IX secretion system PorP/SprF family membrane protein